MSQWKCTEKYSAVRGFAYFPSFGCNGISLWIMNFDEDKFRYEIRKGKEKFPSFNTAVMTLSFDAWCTDKELYIKNLDTAFNILKEENIHSIARYFNSCFGTPAFGGYTAECVQSQMIPVYRAYMRDSLKVMADKDILIHDISNEPLNNTYGSIEAQKRIRRFIAAMYEEIKKCDDRPITIGTQGYFDDDDEDSRQGWKTDENSETGSEFVKNDILFFADYMDVISLHPYNVQNLTQEEFEKDFRRRLDRLEKLGKPVIVTECCWGAVDEEGRKNFLESEITTYKKCRVGFSCHVLVTSRVADCFPFDDRTEMTEGLYMAFLDENYEIRKYHDIFND